MILRTREKVQLKVYMRGKQSSPRTFSKIVLVVLLAPVVFPLILLGLLLYLPSLIAIYLLIWTVWLPRGKDVLFVSSNSPIWQEYMTTQILPRVQERAIVLNWSERKNWSRWSFRVYVFHFFGGRREFNPMVALFRPFHRAQTFQGFGAIQ